jgi:Cof subfamily protein (haloacid dehalogenase superfamily)
MKISAFVSDVDGTIVNHDKEVTQRTREAAAKLKDRGIALTIVSSRPPRGMRKVVEALGLTAPIAGYNGGQFTGPDLTPIEEHPIAPDVARRAHDLLAARSVSIWVFDGLDWMVRDPKGPHVAPEQHTVGYDPIVVKDFDKALANAHKIVGVSDDYDDLAHVETEMQAALGNAASAARSQKYYLDITHPMANKGAAFHRLAELMGVPITEIAVIGDGGNDVAMFEQCPFSIAMGNASDEVKKHARYVTGSNDEDGFAAAVDKYILGAAP